MASINLTSATGLTWIAAQWEHKHWMSCLFVLLQEDPQVTYFLWAEAEWKTASSTDLCGAAHPDACNRPRVFHQRWAHYHWRLTATSLHFISTTMRLLSWQGKKNVSNDLHLYNLNLDWPADARSRVWGQMVFVSNLPSLLFTVLAIGLQ